MAAAREPGHQHHEGRSFLRTLLPVEVLFGELQTDVDERLAQRLRRAAEAERERHERSEEGAVHGSLGVFVWGVPVGARRSERAVRGRGAACEVALLGEVFAPVSGRAGDRCDRSVTAPS